MKSQPALSESVRNKIDQWLKKFPTDKKQSGVLYALRLVQEENGGWLTEQLMDDVADYLDMPHIAVYEVATFYTMYDLKPVGQHKINICTNISCMLRGSNRIVDYLEDRLGIKLGETTPDGRFTLRAVECLAACGNAPVMQIDDRKYYEDLTPEKVDLILGEVNAAETMVLNEINSEEAF
jgi:NADH-quinone oxidoreductase subunit E